MKFALLCGFSSTVGLRNWEDCTHTSNLRYRDRTMIYQNNKLEKWWPEVVLQYSKTILKARVHALKITRIPLTIESERARLTLISATSTQPETILIRISKGEAGEWVPATEGGCQEARDTRLWRWAARYCYSFTIFSGNLDILESWIAFWYLRSMLWFSNLQSSPRICTCNVWQQPW